MFMFNTRANLQRFISTAFDPDYDLVEISDVDITTQRNIFLRFVDTGNTVDVTEELPFDSIVRITNNRMDVQFITSDGRRILSGVANFIGTLSASTSATSTFGEGTTLNFRAGEGIILNADQDSDRITISAPHVHSGSNADNNIRSIAGGTYEPNTPNTCLLYTSPSPRD